MKATDWIGPGAAVLPAAAMAVRYQARRWLDRRAYRRSRFAAARARHPSAMARRPW